jgi:hypothetical protein
MSTQGAKGSEHTRSFLDRQVGSVMKISAVMTSKIVRPAELLHSRRVICWLGCGEEGFGETFESLNGEIVGSIG